MDWDVATIVEALEELYPLQAEHKHLDFGSRWQQVVDKSVSRVRVQSDRMEQVRSDTIYEWSSGIFLAICRLVLSRDWPSPSRIVTTRMEIPIPT